MTSDQILQGGQMTVRAVLSGQAFTARVIGSDAAQDLALLKLSGGSGFKAVAIGNSQEFAVGGDVTAIGSTGIGKTFTPEPGNVTSLNGTATISGRKLTGLFVTTSKVLGGQGTGGPLVNLSGHVIGIDVAGTGSAACTVSASRSL